MDTTRSTYGLWACAVLLPGLLYIGLTMCIWESPRALGGLADSLQTAAVLLSIPIVAAPFAVIYYLTLTLLNLRVPAKRNGSLSACGAWICYAALFGIAFGNGTHKRYSTFARATHPGAMIIEALDKYRSDQGHYPEHLDELVPKYLDSIPYTGLIAYPRFDYWKDRHDQEVAPGEYELRIFCPSGGINFDRFIYWPSQNYPPRIQGNGISRIGAWAYMHE
jgi:hypothetical protein